MPIKDKKSQTSKESAKTSINLKLLWMPVLTLCILIFFSYSSSLDNKFTNWDDGFYVTGNKSVQKITMENIKIMFSKLVTDVYVPLTLLSFAVEYHFVQLKPFSYILHNILLHIAVTLMIFIFGLKIGLKERAAFLGALIFGLHPMHVESVAWITERKDVLYAFFYMLAILVYWKYLENKKLSVFIWTIALGLLSMLSKPMALSLPFVLLVCDWLYGRKFNRQVFIEKGIHLIYIVPIAYLTFKAHHARAPLKDFVEGYMLWIWSFTFYLKKFFFPLTLDPIYNVPKPIGFAHIDYNIAFIIFGIFIYMMIRHHQNRWLRFAFFYYFASIFFIIRMKTEIHVSTVADRFMYLPSLGFCLLIGYFIDDRLSHFLKRTRWKYITTAVITLLFFCLLALKTYKQCDVWKDSETIWNIVLKTSPNSTAYNNRGQMYLDSKRFELAIKDFNMAIKILPKHSQAHYNKGIAFQEQNKFEEAIASYDNALKYNPQYYQAYHNKSFVYLKMKKYDLALENCTKGLSINPKSEGMLGNCAKAYLNLGQLGKALESALKAKELGYSSADAVIADIKKAEAKTKNQVKK